ncbi:MAG: TolC family protein [Edaphocola sp.]
MDYLKKNKWVALVAGLMAGSSSYLAAQPAKQLTLNEAIELSINNSKSLKLSDAKVAEAAAALDEAKMKQYPDLKVQAAYMRLNQPNYNLKISSGSSDTTGSGSQSSEIKVNQVMYGMATASVPLFAGLQIRNGIEAAKYLKTAAELDARQDKAALVQNTIAAYFNLYKAQSAVALVRENLKQATQRVKDFGNLETNGLLARNDLLKAQLQKSNVELALLDAENNLRITNFNMDLMLGLDENTQLEITGNAMGNPHNVPSMPEWETGALANRADLKAMQQRGLAGKAGVKAAIGGYYPSLALTGGYVAADVPNVFSVYNAINVGVGLSYNIASLYKNGATVKKAKAQEQQLYWAQAELSDGIKMQIHQAYQNYMESLKKVEVYKVAVEQANENYRITKNKYDNALVNTTDLLDADVAQLQAHLNYEFAKADAEVAYNKLHETAGDTDYGSTKK